MPTIGSGRISSTGTITLPASGPAASSIVNNTYTIPNTGIPILSNVQQTSGNSQSVSLRNIDAGPGITLTVSNDVIYIATKDLTGLAPIAYLQIGNGLTSSNGSISANVQTVFGRTGAIVLQTTDITNTLGYTPLSASSNLSDLTNVSNARTNLGLGTMAVQNANSVAITGGTLGASVTGVTASSGDNSTALATTAFVKEQGYLTGVSTIASNTILSNITGSTAAPIGNTLSAILDSTFASTQGIIIYRGATGWQTLATGTSGQVLQTQGASANPQWTNAVLSFNTRTGAVTLTSSDVTTALGYSPVATVAGRTGAVTLTVSDVSGAAPLASPTFTGTPNSTTPASNDNSTRIATTAWVQEQGYLSSSSPMPYDIAGLYLGTNYSASLLLWTWTAPRSITLPASLTGSQGRCETAPTGSVSLSITQNGTVIGSINFAASATSATFTFASQVVLAAGDKLQVIVSASFTSDATFAQPSWTFVGTR